MAFRKAVAAATVDDSKLLIGNAGLGQEYEARTKNWTQEVNVEGRRGYVAYTVNIPHWVCAVLCRLLAVVAIPLLY
jgi:hypothetical protein